jgi:hypothetical protein
MCRETSHVYRRLSITDVTINRPIVLKELSTLCNNRLCNNNITITTTITYPAVCAIQHHHLATQWLFCRSDSPLTLSAVGYVNIPSINLPFY